MSLLHRQLLSSFLKEIEPIALKTLESAAVLAGPAAPVIDMALETADAAIRANNPDIGKAAAPSSPFPTPAETAAAPAAAAPAPAPTPAPAPAPAPDAVAAAISVVKAMQAQLAQVLATLSPT